MTHQTKLIAQNRREQEARDEQKRLADEMCMRLTEQFLPDLHIPDVSGTNDIVNPPVTASSSEPPVKTVCDTKKVKTERDPDDSIAPKFDNKSSEETLDEFKKLSDFDKTTELSKATVNFLKDVSDLVMDRDVLLALRRLKFVGKQMFSQQCSTEQFQAEFDSYNTSERERQADQCERQPDHLLTVQTGSTSSSHVRNIDFQGGVKIKEEKEEFLTPKSKKQFPGAKRASYEELQDQFSSKRRKTGPSSQPSPGRGNKPGLGSPPPKINLVSDCKGLTDTKAKVIAQGVDALKKKRNAKTLDTILSELEKMNREILTPTDPNFYHLMSYFDQKYSKIPESARGQQVKSDLFDFILTRVDYSRVSTSTLNLIIHALRKLKL